MRARISSEVAGNRTTPVCPHCGSPNMGEAAISLEAIVDNWPLDRFIAADPDGYAMPDQSVTVSCPDCERPSQIRVIDPRFMLIASRTEKDLQLSGAQP